MPNKKCNWIGTSKIPYSYSIYKFPVRFNEGQDGNYIFCKLVERKWRPIYIGQGDLGKKVTLQHHKLDCIIKNGATHVHVHLNAKEEDRKSEESDLLANYGQAYEPKGCNEKEGG